VVSERNITALFGLRRGSRSADFDRFARLTGDVYRRLAQHTDANVIVDSSKRPSFAAFLRHVPGISLRFLHLVRDPRASAYSWRERRHESATPGAEVTRRGALDSTLRWSILNTEAELIRTRESSETFMRLRYEDFVNAPRSTIDRLATFVGEPPDLSPFVDAHSVRIGTHHAIAGNPSRYATGVVRIRDAGEWRRSQSRADRWIATAASAPFLPHYGYPLAPRRESPESSSAHG
jgi:hypothetical protein